MITSDFGPPFDNPAWGERKEEIKDFIESNWIYSKAENYVREMLHDLWTALEAEESDVGMLAKNLAEIYDEVSGGRISKPNTLPSEVIGVFNERLNEHYLQGWEDGKDDGIAGEDI